MGFKYLKPYTHNALDLPTFTNECEDTVKLVVLTVSIMAPLEGNPLGFRFRKTIKLFSGFKLNLSKACISTSIGVSRATVNISKRGARCTVGIPGTGISYSDTMSAPTVTNVEPVLGEGGQSKAGMGFGFLFLWGAVGLFSSLLIYGFVTR